MKKLLMILVACSFILTACADQTNKTYVEQVEDLIVSGELKNVKMLEKREDKDDKGNPVYLATFSGGTQKFELKVDKLLYNSLDTETLLNISYSDDNKVVIVEFPN